MQLTLNSYWFIKFKKIPSVLGTSARSDLLFSEMVPPVSHLSFPIEETLINTWWSLLLSVIWIGLDLFYLRNCPFSIPILNLTLSNTSLKRLKKNSKALFFEIMWQFSHILVHSWVCFHLVKGKMVQKVIFLKRIWIIKNIVDGNCLSYLETHEKTCFGVRLLPRKVATLSTTPPRSDFISSKVRKSRFSSCLAFQ